MIANVDCLDVSESLVRTGGTSRQLHARIGGRAKERVALRMEPISYWA